MGNKISIITPTYNSAETIERCINSVLMQNHPHFEHIVVDGLSSDGTQKILDKYSHITYISEKDKGIADALNKGFKLCTGNIIGILNSDDYYNSEAFNAIIPYFKNDIKFVVGKIKVVRADGSFFINDPKTLFDDMIYHWQNKAFPVNPVGYFYSRDIHEIVGGYNPLNKYAMDLEFLLKASLQTNFIKIDSSLPELGVFHLHKGSITARAFTNPFFFNKKNFFFVNNLYQNLNAKAKRDFPKLRRIGYLKRNIIIINRNICESKGLQKCIHYIYLFYAKSLLNICLIFSIRNSPSK